MSLEYNLQSKHKLKFKDGKFKILMMSDFQENLEFNEKTRAMMEKLVEKVQPDFVMLGGDNCDGLVLKTADELDRYLGILTEPMEKRQIPWAHIFGNHDHDMDADGYEQANVYESYPFCVSKHTEGIYGTTNFVLPVYGTSGDTIAFNLWGLDTNNRIYDTDINYEKNMKDYKGSTVSGPYDIIRFDQLMWYWNSSRELEEYNKSKVNGIMFLHIAPWEFQFVLDNAELTGAKGNMTERLDLGMFNSGVFSTILQRGDIKCIACAHTHNDCFQGDFCGVKMCLDACAGYSPYGTDSLRGGRVFELDENDTANIHTYMVHYKDLK